VTGFFSISPRLHHPQVVSSTAAMFRSVLVAAIAGTAAAFAPSAPLGRATTGRAVGVYPP